MNEFWVFINKQFLETEFVLQFLIIVVLCSPKFERRNNFWLRFILTTAASLVFYRIIGKIQSTFFIQSTICFIFVYFFTFCFCAAMVPINYKCSFWSGLFCCVAAYASQHMAYCFRDIVFSSLGYAIWNISSHWLLWDAVTCLCFGLVYVGVYFLFIRKMYKKSFTNIQNRKMILLTIVVIALCLVLFSYIRIKDLTMRLLFRLSTALTCFVVLCYQFSLLDESDARHEAKMLKWLLQQSQKQYNNVKDNVLVINVKCHDIKEQIRLFGKREKLDERFVGELESVVKVYDSTMKTGNDALDIILQDKMLSCDSNNIAFDCFVDGSRLSFLTSMDMYSLFGNLIQNAIEAVKQIEDRSKRSINLIGKTKDNLFLLNCDNYFIPDTLTIENGMPVTTKETQSVFHGYGIKSIALIVEKYKGSISITSNGDIFSVSVVIPLTNN